MGLINVNTSLNGRLIAADGKMVSMAEHFDPFIVDYQMQHPSVWRDRIPKGTFPLYSGYSQSTYIFRGTLGPQAGMTEWTQVEPSRKPSGTDLGYDACSYNPQTYTWGAEQVQNSGLQTSWRSPVFCLQDMKFQDQAKVQLGFIVKAGTQITDQVRETFNRESYVRAAVDAHKFFVLTDGAPLDHIDSTATRVTYDPFVKNSDGDTYIKFPAAVLPKISSLNWNALETLRSYMADQCPDAAQGTDSGMPIFGLMTDLLDFQKMVYNDDDLREDFRYAKPQQLIAGFDMGFKVYRGFALIHDVRQMRFSYLSSDGTDVTATRVLPRRAVRPGVIGSIPEANPAYVTAVLGTAIIFLSDVIQIQVPPTETNLGNGMVFAPQPGFNGDWTWLNIQDAETNPLNEIGYFFARFQYFVKPLQYAQEATVILYRRCTQSLGTGCSVEVASDAADSATLSVATTASDFSATNRQVTFQLSNRLTGELGDAVLITRDSAVQFAANIVDDSKAPTYTFGWATGATNAPTAFGDVNDTTVVKVDMV